MENEKQEKSDIIGLGILIVFVIVVSVLYFYALDKKVKEDDRVEAVEEEYYQTMLDSCEGYRTDECQVIRVYSQTTELQPYQVELSYYEDFTSSHIKSITIPSGVVLPEEKLDQKYVKLLLSEGFITSLEVVGSHKELEELRREQREK